MNQVFTVILTILSIIGWFFVLGAFIFGELLSGPMIRLSVLTIAFTWVVYKYGNREVF